MEVVLERGLIPRYFAPLVPPAALRFGADPEHPEHSKLITHNTFVGKSPHCDRFMLISVLASLFLNLCSIEHDASRYTRRPEAGLMHICLVSTYVHIRGIVI